MAEYNVKRESYLPECENIKHSVRANRVTLAAYQQQLWSEKSTQERHEYTHLAMVRPLAPSPSWRHPVHGLSPSLSYTHTLGR